MDNNHKKSQEELISLHGQDPVVQMMISCNRPITLENYQIFMMDGGLPEPDAEVLSMLTPDWVYELEEE